MDPQSAVIEDRPLAADWSEHLGWFRFYFDNDRWTWSPQVEEMHGYQPGTTAPSTLLTLSHVYLDDYHKVAASLQDARRNEQPFSSRHRIMDTRHHLHHVVMIGAPFYDREGAAAGIQGFCLDVTAVNVTVGTNGHSPARRQRVRAATQC